MSVVISDVEYSPSPDAGADSAASPAQQARGLGSDEILAVLRRERDRRARLWAD